MTLDTPTPRRSPTRPSRTGGPPARSACVQVQVPGATSSTAPTTRSFGQLTAGNIDWINNFLPGINQLMQAQWAATAVTRSRPTTRRRRTCCRRNTVWLEPNTTKAPMSNVNFRKALAYALNPSAIAQTVYGGIAKAANPTGLLPNLSSYIDQGVVSQNGAPPTTRPRPSSTWRSPATTARPSPWRCPTGWSDWMDAHHGHRVRSSTRSASRCSSPTRRPTPRTADVTNGNYDLALDNNAGLDSTPWSYFQRVYQLPIAASSRPPSSTGSGTARRRTGRWCSRRRHAR